MFNKNDPLVESVKKIMEKNELHRQVEASLCEELGIASRKQLPHEHQANYDALLEQRLDEALKGDQDKIDANNNNKIDAQDFKLLRSKKFNEEEQLNEIGDTKKGKDALKSYVKKASHDVATKSAATGRYAERSNKEADHRKKTGDTSGYRQGRKDNETADKFFNKSWNRRKGIARAVDRLEEEQLDEISRDLATRYIKKAKSSTKDSYYGDDAPTMGKRKKGIDLALKKKWGDKNYGLPEPKVKATNEEMQDSKNPVPSSALERIRNKLGTGPKSTFSGSRPAGEGPSEADREALKSKLNEISKERVVDYIKKAKADQLHLAGTRGSHGAKKTERYQKSEKGISTGLDKLTGKARVSAKEEVELEEAAKSKSQQRIMGMALAMRRGESDRGNREVARIATDMPEKELKKYAKTKHKDLPEKKK
jgi:hypothetical protein